MLKFLTRKALFVPVLTILGVIECLVPNLLNNLPQTLSDTVLNTIFGDGAADTVNHLLDFLDGRKPAA